MAESRRDFLQKISRRGISTVVITTVAASTIGGIYHGLSSEGDDSTINPNPLKKEDASTKQLVIDCKDIYVGGIPIKLCGVEHSRSFASEHYDYLEDLIRHASFIVSESNPEKVKRRTVLNNAKAYFATTYQLAQQFKKSVISLDQVSFLGPNIEIFFEGFGGALYSCVHAVNLGKKNINPKMTRKELLKTALGFYFFASAFAPGGLQLKSWLSGSGEEGLETFIDREPCFYDYIIDQRNVELTTRLQNLENIVPPEEFVKGDYVLVNFGEGHTLGIEYYLNHPIVHKIKSALYAPTYGLVDSNEIALYVPDGLNKWTKKDLA